MKNSHKIYLLTILIFLFAFTLFSCEKDEGNLPNISFVTGVGYTSADKTVGQGQVVIFGINASKAEEKDVLKTFNISKSINGGASTTILQEDLSGSQGDSYSKTVQITTRNHSGIETYTFTVTNRDGLSNSVSVNLIVN
jgi:hypothetical protein